MENCKHYNQGYCYHFSDSRTKEFCENECEHNCGVDINEDIEDKLHFDDVSDMW